MMTTIATPPPQQRHGIRWPKQHARRPPKPNRPSASPTPTALAVHSFHSLLADLATLTRNEVVTAAAPDIVLTLYARPTAIQQKVQFSRWLGTLTIGRIIPVNGQDSMDVGKFRAWLSGMSTPERRHKTGSFVLDQRQGNPRNCEPATASWAGDSGYDKVALHKS